MKRFFIWLLVLCTALTVGISAHGIDGPRFFLVEDSSRWLLVLWPDTGLQTLADQYVLDYHYDPENDVLWYTAMEGNEPVLCSIDPRGGQPVYHDVFEDAETLAARQEPPILLFGAPNKTVGQLVQAAMGIIYANEGNYGSVNADDHGALSIGKVQWHADRALNLLKTIVSADEAQARAILGDALCDEIITAESWKTRTVDAVEKNAISTLLKTETGKAAQDALAEKDITDYIHYGINKGLESSLALVYFADLQNQWGSGGAYKQLQKAAGEGAIADVTLEMLHEACLDYTVNYHARRQSVYEYCMDLGWEEFLVSLTMPRNVQVSCVGKTADVTWDPVENAAYYTCSIITFTPQTGFAPIGEPIRVETNACTLTLEEPGTYYAQITAWAGSIQSEGSLLIQSRVDVLQTPAVQQVTFSEEGVTLFWDNVPYATGYTCRITDENGQQVCAPVETYDRSCTVSLEAGREYQAFVTACCQGSISEESDGFAFWVPVGVPTNVQATARKGNVTVTWAAAQNAQSYRVELLQEDKVVYTADTDRLSHTFAVVPNGDYTARVAALPDPQGVYGEAFAFSVTDTDPAGKPESEAAVERQEGLCVVQVTMFYTEAPCFVLAAGYQEGRMVSIGLAQSDPNGNLFLLDGDADEVRVLAVDSLTAMRPLCHLLHIPQAAFFETQPQ